MELACSLPCFKLPANRPFPKADQLISTHAVRLTLVQGTNHKHCDVANIGGYIWQMKRVPSLYLNKGLFTKKKKIQP